MGQNADKNTDSRPAGGDDADDAADTLERDISEALDLEAIGAAAGDDDAVGDDAGDDDAAADDAGDDEAGDDAAGGDDEAGAPAGEIAELKAAVAALTEKLSGLTGEGRGGAPLPGAPAGGGAQPAGAEAEVLGAETDADLDRLREKFAGIEDWALENADGAELPSRDKDGEPVTYTPEQVRKIGLSARKALRAIPARKAFLAERANYDRLAADLYPDLADTKSEVAKAVAYYQGTPLRSVPYLKLLVADALAGKRAREAAAKGKGAPGAPAPRPAKAAPAALPRPPARRPPPPATDAQKRRAAARAAAIANSGDADSIAAMLE